VDGAFDRVAGFRAVVVRFADEARGFGGEEGPVPFVAAVVSAAAAAFVPAVAVGFVPAVPAAPAARRRVDVDLVEDRRVVVPAFAAAELEARRRAGAFDPGFGPRFAPTFVAGVVAAWRSLMP
jgi:hypothetical protein